MVAQKRLSLTLLLYMFLVTANGQGREYFFMGLDPVTHDSLFCLPITAEEIDLSGMRRLEAANCEKQQDSLTRIIGTYEKEASNFDFQIQNNIRDYNNCYTDLAKFKGIANTATAQIEGLIVDKDELGKRVTGLERSKQGWKGATTAVSACLVVSVLLLIVLN